MSRRTNIIIGLCVAAIVGAAGPGAGAATITVTTEQDTFFFDPEVNADLDDPQVALATQVCLGGRPDLVNKDTIKGTVTGKPVVGGSDVDGCSLRMALTVAAANRSANETGSTATDRDTIKFSLPKGKDTIVLEDNQLLPPIVREGLSIEGCPSGSTRPCVNVQIPSSLAPLDLLPGAVLPGSVPGLIVAADEVSIDGIAFLGGSPAIWAVPGVDRAGIDRLTVTNSYFGVTTAGDVDSSTTGVGVMLSGSRATIGGTEPGQRNVFATGEAGVLIAGGARNLVSGNWFGTDADGQQARRGNQAERLRTGVKIVGLGYDTTALIEDLPRTVTDLLGLQDADADSSVPAAGRFNSLAVSNTVEDNLFAGAADAAIDVGGLPTLSAAELAAVGVPDTDGDLVGASRTTIERNRIGVDADSDPAPNRNAGIYLRNGSERTSIGGGQSSDGNTISNTSNGPGVLVEISAGLGTEFERNLGWRNRGPILQLDPGVSGGILPPAITSAEPTVARGTAAPNAEVLVYAVTPQEHASRSGDIESFAGSARADSSGNWSAILSSPLAVGRKVTATADAGDGTSGLARNLAVTAAPEPEIEPPPPAPAPPLPPAPRPDRSAPQVVSVFGGLPASAPVNVSSGQLRELSGQLSDASGVARVELALRVLSAPAKGRATARPCQFIDLRSGRLLARSCAKPAFSPARGTDRWSLRLRAPVRKRLRPGGRYILYVRATDRLGNRRTSRLRFAVSRER